MKNNKLVMTMFILLVIIALVGAVAIIMLLNTNNNQGKDSKPTIDEVLEMSVDIKEITTNLASNDFIRISFKIQTDSKECERRTSETRFSSQ